MSVHTNAGGTWKTCKSVHVNVSGTWKQCKQVYVNVSGTWKPLLLTTKSATVTKSGLSRNETITATNVKVGSTVKFSGTAYLWDKSGGSTVNYWVQVSGSTNDGNLQVATANWNDVKFSVNITAKSSTVTVKSLVGGPDGLTGVKLEFTQEYYP